MSSRRWLIILPVLILLAIGCCAAFNILIDPFGVFGDPILNWYSYNETSNPRVAKLAWLDRHHEEYDSYVIGSSPASSYSVEELNEYLDASFYNLFVPDCSAGDYRDLAAYVLEHCAVKHIILDLNLSEAACCGDGDDSLGGRMHAKASGGSLPLFYLEYALAPVLQSAEKLASRSRDTELPQEFDVFLAESGCYDRRAQDVETVGDMAAYEKACAGKFSVPEGPEELPYIQECVRMVAEVRDMCSEHGASLTVIMSPVYAGRWSAYDEDALRAYKTALADVTDYWDFSCTPVSCDSRYFYDRDHFRSAVGTMVLGEIFGNDEVWRPERFGTQVTADNCGAYLDGLFSDPPELEAESYTVDVPILLYHNVVEEPDSYLKVSPETFDAQMSFLVENGYHAVTTQDLVDYVCHGGELPDKPVFISFDDGYRDNYENAFPILKKHGLKATIYAIGVSVGHVLYYKDTQFEMTPHFSFEEAREMVASGVIDVQSHTYDMHQWAPFESGDQIREYMVPLEGESDAEYAAALSGDMAVYDHLVREELGYGFSSLAFPSGKYTALSEVLVHQAGIPVTMSTRSDRRNVLVRGLPQSLCALSRWYIGEDTVDLLGVLNG